jgi:hypothetical protein
MITVGYVESEFLANSLAAILTAFCPKLLRDSRDSIIESSG